MKAVLHLRTMAESCQLRPNPRRGTSPHSRAAVPHVTASATAASFALPYGIAQIGDTLYVTDRASHSIRTVHTSTARVGMIVPGNVASSGAHLDGPGASARFDGPVGLAVSEDGNTLYVAEITNHRIRAIDLASTNKTVSTLYFTSGDLIRKLEYREVDP